MLFDEPSTFHESVKPIVQFNWLIGLGVYQQPFTTNIVYICMQVYTFVFTLFNWTTTYIGLTTIADFSAFDDHTSPMSSKMYQVLIYTNSCMAVTSPFLIWRQKKGLSDCLGQMPILDETFQTILGAENNYRKQYIRVTCHIAAIVLVMFLVGLNDSAWIILGEGSSLNKLAIAVVLHYPIMIMLVLDLNFCTFVRYLRKKFQDLNESLLGLAEKRSASHFGKKIFVISRKMLTVTQGCEMEDMKAESLTNDSHYLLHEIRKAHLELCKLCLDVNHAFGIQNLLSMGISFVMITGLLYTIYSAVVLEVFIIDSLTKVVPLVIWTAIYVFKIWFVNYLCRSLSKEADRTGDVIYDLFETRVDQELQKVIQEFAVQMIQNPVRFDACGFFTLDYTFVQGVIGSVTTYLVILIQMNQVPESTTSNSTFVGNGSQTSEN